MSRSVTTMRSTSSRPGTSSSRSAPSRRCRTCPGWTRSSHGRTARRPWPLSCRRAWSSSAAARPAARWPRSTLASAFRHGSSSRASGSCRPITPATPRPSSDGLRGLRGRDPARGPGGGACGRRRAPTAPMSSTSTTARRPRATRSSSRSAGPSRSTTSGSSTTASTRAGGRPFPATDGSGSPRACG